MAGIWIDREFDMVRILTPGFHQSWNLLSILPNLPTPVPAGSHTACEKGAPAVEDRDTHAGEELHHRANRRHYRDAGRRRSGRCRQCWPSAGRKQQQQHVTANRCWRTRPAEQLSCSNPDQSAATGSRGSVSCSRCGSDYHLARSYLRVRRHGARLPRARPAASSPVASAASSSSPSSSAGAGRCRQWRWRWRW